MEVAFHLPDELLQMDDRTKSGKDSEKTNIERQTNDRKLRQAIIVHVVKGHGT